MKQILDDLWYELESKRHNLHRRLHSNEDVMAYYKILGKLDALAAIVSYMNGCETDELSDSILSD